MKRKRIVAWFGLTVFLLVEIECAGADDHTFSTNVIMKMYQSASSSASSNLVAMCRQFDDLLLGRSVLNPRLLRRTYQQALSDVQMISLFKEDGSQFRHSRANRVRLTLGDELYETMENDLVNCGIVSSNEMIKGFSRVFLCKVLASTAGQSTFKRDLQNLAQRGCPSTFQEISDMEVALLDAATYIGDSIAVDYLQGLIANDAVADPETRKFAIRTLNGSGFSVAKSNPQLLMDSNSMIAAEAFRDCGRSVPFHGYEKYGFWQIKRLSKQFVDRGLWSPEDRGLLRDLLVYFPYDVRTGSIKGLSKQEVEELRAAILALVRQGDDDVKEVATMGVFACIVRDEDVELCRDLMKNPRPSVRGKGAYALVRRSKKCIEACSDILLTLLGDESLEVRREAYLALKVGLKEGGDSWASAETIARERPKLEQAYRKR